MRNATWLTAARIVERSLSIEAHSRGSEQPGGFPNAMRGGGARWLGSLTVAPLLSANAHKLRGMLHSLRGTSGTVLVPLDDNAAVATTLASTAAADAETLNVATVVGQLPVVGGFLFAGVAGGVGQLFRVVAISVGATWTVTVRPRVRVSIASGAAVQIKGVTAPFRLRGPTPDVPITLGGRSLPVQIDIEEYY